MSRAALYFILAAILYALGWMSGEAWRRVEPPKIEAPVPERRHASGAVTLERTDSQPPPRLDESPGVARVRTVTLTIQPCEEVRELQLELSRLADGSHRVTVAGDPSITGLDFPADAPPLRIPRWTLAATHDGRRPGALLEYRRGPWAILGGWNGERAWIGAGFSW